MISESVLKQDLNQIHKYIEKQDNEEHLDSTYYCLLHVDQLNDLQSFNCKKCDNKSKSVSADIQMKTYGMVLAKGVPR